MLKRIFLSTLVTLGLSAVEPKGVLLGAAAGTDQRWHLDAGFATTAWGASAKGIHLGGIGQQAQDAKTPASPYTTKAPGRYEDVMTTSGFQVGAFVDIGRAWFALGGESLDIKAKVYTVATDGTWAVDPGEKQLGGSGAYVKVGLKFGSWSIYAGYGTRSKAQVGLGLHF